MPKVIEDWITSIAATWRIELGPYDTDAFVEFYLIHSGKWNGQSIGRAESQLTFGLHTIPWQPPTTKSRWDVKFENYNLPLGDEAQPLRFPVPAGIKCTLVRYARNENADTGLLRSKTRVVAAAGDPQFRADVVRWWTSAEPESKGPSNC